MESLDILVFGAHPDDAEIGMGGTIAKHTAAGCHVGICDLTEAELSSNGTVQLRKKEAEEASDALRLSYRSNLGLPDRGIVQAAEQLDRIVMEIRKCKPRLVFAPYWIDRHPDHTACSRIVEEAVFNAKLRNYKPELGEAVTAQELLFYYINDFQDVSLLVDVSDHYEQKRQALRAYRSQFDLSATDNAVVTPLTGGYLERVEARDALLGGPKGMVFGEGFATKKPYPVNLF